MKKLIFVITVLSFVLSSRAAERLENYTNKTVLIFTPHPDDDTFAVGGTMALLAKNKNRVVVVIYTNDNKGSYDQDMASERLARIRKAEEEASALFLAFPARNVFCLGKVTASWNMFRPKCSVAR